MRARIQVRHRYAAASAPHAFADSARVQYHRVAAQHPIVHLASQNFVCPNPYQAEVHSVPSHTFLFIKAYKAAWGAASVDVDVAGYDASAAADGRWAGNGDEAENDTALWGRHTASALANRPPRRHPKRSPSPPSLPTPVSPLYPPPPPLPPFFTERCTQLSHRVTVQVRPSRARFLGQLSIGFSGANLCRAPGKRVQEQRQWKNKEIHSMVERRSSHMGTIARVHMDVPPRHGVVAQYGL
ncbi:hypothetical protein K438DRAFT_964621 [Mycena galopus ATCC 62051]|nr:hypothetical protein K438DRAFT_964621 [Mycena galopus ATCC 62051]